MGSKKLKAIAVRGSGKVSAARPDRLQELLEYAANLRKDALKGDVSEGEGKSEDHCYGCIDECIRGLYRASDGSTGKVMCQSGDFYRRWAGAYGDRSDDVPFYANRLCDDYGLNTKSVALMITWLERCYQAGLVTEQNTGLPLGKIGSLEFIQTIAGNIAHRQGFGDLLARGIVPAAEAVGSQAVELLSDNVTKSGETLGYVPKAFITTGLLYAVEHREPIQQLHEVSRLSIKWVRWANKVPGANLSSDVFRAIAKRFWGSELAADFSTYDGKALAAKMIQDRQLAKECLILCDNVWPVSYVEHSPDHVGDPSLESKIFSAVTGREMTEEGLYQVGERLLNLQRAVLAREGHRGRVGDSLPEACYVVPLESERLNPDCLFPGKDGEVISRKGAVFERDKFENLLGEFYELRGWDRQTGLQKKSHLESLGLKDVAIDLAVRGLLS